MLLNDLIKPPCLPDVTFTCCPFNIWFCKLLKIFLKHRQCSGFPLNVLLYNRFDKCSSSLKGAAVPNHYSLHHEIQEAEPVHTHTHTLHVESWWVQLPGLKCCFCSFCAKRTHVEQNAGSAPELQPPSSPKRDLYNFIHKIRSAELRVRDCGSINKYINKCGLVWGVGKRSWEFWDR